jgi:hypothetical protein
MDHLIYEDSEIVSARLITETTGKSPQVPVLRVERAELCADFGPRDILEDPWSGKPSRERAADLVFAWANDPERPAEDRREARLFLSQWPTGPQLDQISPSLPHDAHRRGTVP